jgi:hypothetical protein
MLTTCLSCPNVRPRSPTKRTAVEFFCPLRGIAVDVTTPPCRTIPEPPRPERKREEAHLL